MKKTESSRLKKKQNNENMTRKCGSILVEGEDIEKVDQFKYLRSIVIKSGGAEEGISSKICKGRQAIAALKPIWTPNVQSENTKN